MTARSNLLKLIGAALLLLSCAAQAQSEAIHWLERMDAAMHGLDYEGRFVYQHGSNIEAMYLAHTVRDGNEREHLVSLTGNAREVIRDRNAVICISPGDRSAKIDKRPANSRRLSPILRVRPEALSRFYQFELGSTQRVAGRMARIVTISPVDELRYGYRLLLDTEHQLPLGAATFDKEGHQLSQVLFTELKIGDEVTAEAPVLAGQGEVTRTVRPRNPPEAPLPARWAFEDVPPGFAMKLHRRRLVGPDEHEMAHFVFSDGLASVSVYIEEIQGDDVLNGASRMGAVNAFGRRLGEYQATAVGEVPIITLSRFVGGIQAKVGAP